MLLKAYETIPLLVVPKVQFVWTFVVEMTFPVEKSRPDPSDW